MATDTELLEKFDELQVRNCVAGNLRKTTRVVTQFYDTALKPIDLKPGQFTVLATLLRHGPLRPVDLAKRLDLDRTTMIRNVKVLTTRKLVRETEGPDTGLKELMLTDAGRKKLEQALPLWQQAQSQIVNALGLDRWNGFLADMSSTIDAVKHK